ncbi:MAG: hypothetical protein LAO31_16815 [Acidobacteriia bacterium]|nr:hypothetical protein [Terriglobia bacterium]
MRESEEFRRQIFQILKLTIFLTFLVLLCETTATNAQETNTTGTDGWTPPGIAPGSPAGSYPLSGFETVNLYNGSLNFRLPLVQILGRGSAQTAVHLPPLSTKWRINHFYHYEKGPPLKIDESYSPLQDWWSTVPWFAPGSLEGRTVGKDGPVDCTTLSRSAITLTRLTFTSADGTEYELRDARTGGESKFVICTDTYPSAPVGFDRGTVFVTADGSSATFIADNPIIDDYTAAGGQQGIISVAGYLYLRDGTRYRISAADQAPPYNIPGGAVTEMRDRNGNIVTFTYIGGNLSSITDSVGRTVTFQYGAPDLNFSLCRTEGQCDEITFSGVGGASRTIYIVFAYLASALRQTQTYDASQAATNGTLFPDLTPIHASVASLIVNPSKVASVWLPGNSPDDLNGHTLHYQFFYNVYGELARVELPTGGAIEYDHAGVLVSTFTGQGGGGRQVLRKVVERRVYPNLQTQVPELKTTYTYAESPAPQGQVTNTSMSEMDQFDAESHPLASEIHYFFGAPALDLFNNGNEADPLSYPPWKQSKEYQTDLGSPLLKRQTNTWNQQPPSWWSMVSPDLAPANNPVIVETDTTLDDGQTSKQLFFYDKYNNRTDISEYDYGSTTPERHTHICYLINGNDCNVSAGLPGNSGYFYDTVNPPNSGSPDPNATIHLRSLPARQFVYDRSGSLQSMTKFEYDSYTEGISSTNAVQHGSIFTTNYLSRGNLTATMQCLGTPPLDQNNCPTWLTTRNQYNDAGNVVKTTDPRTNFTTFDYTDSWGNDTCKPSSGSAAAYVKKVTNALEQVTSYTYDSCTGKPISITDPNNQETDYAYDDLLDRLKTVTFPLVPVGQNSYHPTTVYTYNDNALNVVTARDLNSSGDGVIKTKSVYDGLARVIQTQLMSDPQGIVYADTTYDALGRKHTVSNPYRSTSDETYGMTTFGYDGLSRVKTTETTDRFNASTGVVTTDYYGNTTTVTDQAGKPRRSLTDALGRLIRVDEPDKTTGVLGDVNSPVQPTSYTYDALDDLTTVIQGQQTRYFMYDSLKRLVRAKNPEQDVNASLNLLDLVTGNRQWSQGYSYDGNGNLLTKTDTRGITTTMTRVSATPRAASPRSIPAFQSRTSRVMMAWGE